MDRFSIIIERQEQLEALIKEWGFRITRKVAHEVNSQALEANAWHHRSDALSSIGTAIGIGGAVVLGDSWALLDPLAAIIVSILIFRYRVPSSAPGIRRIIGRKSAPRNRE